jgi:phosphatidylglycerophosphate synthase
MSVRILSGEYALASGILVVACLLDVGDGWVARRFNQTSKLGSYLDPLADKVLLTCAAVPLGVMGALPLPLVALWGARDVALVVGGLYLRSATRPPGVSFFNMTHSSVPTVEPTGVSKVNTGLQGGLAVAALLGLALEGGWEGVQGAAAAASALPATDFLFSPAGFNTSISGAADAAAAAVRSALEYSTGFVGGVVNVCSAYFPTHLLYSNPSCFQLACAASTATTLWSWADYTHKQKVGLDNFQRMVEGKEVVPLYHADTLVKRGERGDKV